jgi:hypothetical protein
MDSDSGSGSDSDSRDVWPEEPEEPEPEPDHERVQSPEDVLEPPAGVPEIRGLPGLSITLQPTMRKV